MATKTKSSSAGDISKIKVSIRGLSPLIFQGKGLMTEDAKSNSKKKKAREPAEEAKLRAHWVGTGKDRSLCIPWVMLYKSICTAAGSFKYRGNKTMSTIVAATITCEDDRISLGTDKYEVYEEFVRVPPRTGAMVNIGRPKLREWKASFVLMVDDEMYSAEGLKDIIAHAGKLVGIGAWRPELKGPHGRFEVVEFETV